MLELEHGARCPVCLTRARRTEALRVEEATAEEAAPLLKRYLKAVAVVRPFFDVKPDSSIGEFTREAPDTRSSGSPRGDRSYKRERGPGSSWHTGHGRCVARSTMGSGLS